MASPSNTNIRKVGISRDPIVLTALRCLRTRLCCGKWRARRWAQGSSSRVVEAASLKVNAEEKRDMSSVQSERRERSWIAALQSILLKCQAYTGWWRRRVDQDQPVAEVADDLCTRMEIWTVDAGLQTKAHIACWHRLL